MRSLSGQMMRRANQNEPEPEEEAAPFARHLATFEEELGVAVKNSINSILDEVARVAAAEGKDEEVVAMLEDPLRNTCEGLLRRGREFASALSDADRACHRKALKKQAFVFDMKKEQLRTVKEVSLKDQKVHMQAEHRADVQQKLATQLEELNADSGGLLRAAQAKELLLLDQITALTTRAEVAEADSRESEEGLKKTKRLLRESERQIKDSEVKMRDFELKLKKSELELESASKRLSEGEQREGILKRTIESRDATIAAFDSQIEEVKAVHAMQCEAFMAEQVSQAAALEAAVAESRATEERMQKEADAAAVMAAEAVAQACEREQVVAETRLAEQRARLRVEFGAGARAEVATLLASLRDAERDVTDGLEALKALTAVSSELAASRCEEVRLKGIVDELEAKVADLLKQLSKEPESPPEPSTDFAEAMALKLKEAELKMHAALDEAQRSRGDAAVWRDNFERLAGEVAVGEANINRALRKGVIRARAELPPGENPLTPDKMAVRNLRDGSVELSEKYDHSLASLAHVQKELRFTVEELSRVSTAAQEQREALVQTALDSLFQLRRHLANLQAFQLNHDHDEEASRRRAKAAGLLGAAAHKVERSGEAMISRMASSVTPSNTEPWGSSMIALTPEQPPRIEPVSPDLRPRSARATVGTTPSHYLRSVAPILSVTKSPTSARPQRLPPRPMSAAGATLAPHAATRMGDRMKERSRRRSKSFDMPQSRMTAIDREQAPPIFMRVSDVFDAFG